jgi:hypothetical protein
VSQTTLSRVWSVSALALVYFSLNAWSLSQQWQLSLPGDPFREGKFTPHGVTLVAIPLAGALLILTAFLARLFAKRTKTGGWANRLPRFSNLAIDVSTTEGKCFQAASLCVFVLLPTAAQIHFMLKFLAGTAYRADVKLWSGIEHLRHYVPLHEALSGAYTYDRLGELAPTFAPFWEPWLLVLLEAAVFSAVSLCLLALFKPSARKRQPRLTPPSRL